VQYAVTASAGYIGASRWSVRGSIGAVIDGSLEEGGRTHDIGPGIVAAASVSKQWAFGDWFVTGSLGAGISRTTTREGRSGMGDGESQSLIGIDVLRIGVMAGRTFGIVSPYLMARGFGGPVLWTLDEMDVTGTDTSKFQLGGGVSVTASGLSFLLDVSALGERSASLGMSYQL
jgi:hypothetical protein